MDHFWLAIMSGLDYFCQDRTILAANNIDLGGLLFLQKMVLGPILAVTVLCYYRNTHTHTQRKYCKPCPGRVQGG